MDDEALTLPEPERRTWLLAALSGLLRDAPWRPFVATPLVLPGPAFFPELWSPDVRGVRRLTRRLLRFADLDLGLHVELFEGRPPQVDSLGMRLGVSAASKGTPGLYFGTRGGVAHFGADAGKLADPAAVTASLAFEVARAFRDHHDLRDPDPGSEDQLAELTAVYLGLGVLIADASVRPRPRDRSWTTQRPGGLTPQELCLLLAAQAHVRGPARVDPREITDHLAPAQVAMFSAAARWLADEHPDLADELGLPPAASWPPPDDLAALARSLDDDDETTPAPPPGPSSADTATLRRVFRVWRRPWSERLGVSLAVAAAAVAIAILVAADPIGLTLVTTLAILIVVATGHYRHPRCSEPACQSPLTRDADACPRCGGTIAGDLDFADQRLAAERLLADQDPAA